MRARGQEPVELSPVAGLRGWEGPRVGLLTLLVSTFLSCLDMGERVYEYTKWACGEACSSSPALVLHRQGTAWDSNEFGSPG